MREQIHRELAQLRISEMFDIIVDFPESAPALHDLRVWFGVAHVFGLPGDIAIPMQFTRGRRATRARACLVGESTAASFAPGGRHG